MLLAIILGAMVGAYGVYAVVFVYKHKGSPKAEIVRVFGVSSVAIVATLGLYLLQHISAGSAEMDLEVSIGFTVSLLSTLLLFFWINRKKIG